MTYKPEEEEFSEETKLPNDGPEQQTLVVVSNVETETPPPPPPPPPQSSLDTEDLLVDYQI